jgi:Sap, sulfolipid-1-addressing protein
MWSSVLALGLLAGLDPVRLGITLFVISRPRPVQNLLAYGVGCLIPGVTVMLVPLIVLHVTPMSTSFAQGFASSTTSSTARYIQIGMGVLALSIAALMTVRSLTRRRQRAQLPTPGGTTAVLDSNTSPIISRLLGRTQDAATEGGTAITRLRRRIRNAWENGSLWVSVVIGLALAGPQPGEYLFVLAIIVASRSAIGTQVGAASLYLIAMLAVVDIIVVSYLAVPAKTQAIVQLLQDWTLAHRRQILIAVFAVAGVASVANGIAGVIV